MKTAITNDTIFHTPYKTCFI